MRIVYLHGFASSPQSGKAQFFRRKFEERGIEIAIPALDQGDFEHMTISGMLDLVDAAVEGRPCLMMGSSLGGFVAGLYAARNPEWVERLVLLAPALEFAKKWQERFRGHELEEWKRQGSKNFFHYGYKRQERLAYGFVEDALRFEGEPNFGQPALILHGTQDDVVPVQLSRDYALRHANVLLKEFPSGHELTDVTAELWKETAAFLGLADGPGKDA
jgi:pimeloyl-ACP methyl ester carboxylesterase